MVSRPILHITTWVLIIKLFLLLPLISHSLIAAVSREILAGTLNHTVQRSTCHRLNDKTTNIACRCIRNKSAETRSIYLGCSLYNKIQENRCHLEIRSHLGVILDFKSITFLNPNAFDLPCHPIWHYRNHSCPVSKAPFSAVFLFRAFR